MLATRACLVACLILVATSIVANATENSKQHVHHVKHHSTHHTNKSTIKSSHVEPGNASLEGAKLDSMHHKEEPPVVTVEHDPLKNNSMPSTVTTSLQVEVSVLENVTQISTHNEIAPTMNSPMNNDKNESNKTLNGSEIPYLDNLQHNDLELPVLHLKTELTTSVPISAPSNASQVATVQNVTYHKQEATSFPKTDILSQVEVPSVPPLTSPEVATEETPLNVQLNMPKMTLLSVPQIIEPNTPIQVIEDNIHQVNEVLETAQQMSKPDEKQLKDFVQQPKKLETPGVQEVNSIDAPQEEIHANISSIEDVSGAASQLHLTSVKQPYSAEYQHLVYEKRQQTRPVGGMDGLRTMARAETMNGFSNNTGIIKNSPRMAKSRVRISKQDINQLMPNQESLGMEAFQNQDSSSKTAVFKSSQQQDQTKLNMETSEMRGNKNKHKLKGQRKTTGDIHLETPITHRVANKSPSIQQTIEHEHLGVRGNTRTNQMAKGVSQSPSKKRPQAQSTGKKSRGKELPSIQENMNTEPSDAYSNEQGKPTPDKKHLETHMTGKKIGLEEQPSVQKNLKKSSNKRRNHALQDVSQTHDNTRHEAKVAVEQFGAEDVPTMQKHMNKIRSKTRADKHGNHAPLEESHPQVYINLEAQVTGQQTGPKELPTVHKALNTVSSRMRGNKRKNHVRSGHNKTPENKQLEVQVTGELTGFEKLPPVQQSVKKFSPELRSNKRTNHALLGGSKSETNMRLEEQVTAQAIVAEKLPLVQENINKLPSEIRGKKRGHHVQSGIKQTSENTNLEAHVTGKQTRLEDLAVVQKTNSNLTLVDSGKIPDKTSLRLRNHPGNKRVKARITRQQFVANDMHETKVKREIGSMENNDKKGREPALSGQIPIASNNHLNAGDNDQQFLTDDTKIIQDNMKVPTEEHSRKRIMNQFQAPTLSFDRFINKQRNVSSESLRRSSNNDEAMARVAKQLFEAVKNKLTKATGKINVAIIKKGIINRKNPAHSLETRPIARVSVRRINLKKPSNVHSNISTDAEGSDRMGIDAHRIKRCTRKSSVTAGHARKHELLKEEKIMDERCIHCIATKQCSKEQMMFCKVFGKYVIIIKFTIIHRMYDIAVVQYGYFIVYVLYVCVNVLTLIHMYLYNRDQITSWYGLVLLAFCLAFFGAFSSWVIEKFYKPL